MRTFACFTKPLIWVVTLLMVALAAGCGGNLGGGNSTPSATKAITAYSVAWTAAAATVTGTSGAVAGVINETLKTIAVTVPYGTSVTALKATFTTTGASVKVGGVTQTSGTTANSFTLPVLYVVTAADGTWATYTVVVTVSQISAKAITSYTLAGTAGVINEGAKTIAVTKPTNTDVRALIATFLTDGASVKVGTTPQVSGTTPNNFTSPVAYIVTAANNSTATYTVTVTTGATSASVVCTGGANCVPLGLADNFTILAQTKITSVPTSPITGNIGVSAAAGSTIVVSCAEMLTGNVYDVDGTYTGGAGCSMPGPGANKTTVDTAVANMGTAYTDAATRVSPVPTNNLGAGNISGMTLTPGMYKWTTPLLIYAGNPNNIGGGDVTGVTLNCTAGGSTSVFIFQISGTLTEGLPATPAQINLTGGCLASNIFWQTTSDVTITPGSVFYGNILTATQVVMQAGAVLHGRALAQTAVTLISNTVGP